MQIYTCINDLISTVSDGYSETDVLYVWTKGANKSIQISPDATLSQFDIIGIPAGNMTRNDIGLGRQV